MGSCRESRGTPDQDLPSEGPVITQDETVSIPSGRTALQCALVTVSGDLSLETDECGLEALRRLEAIGVRVVERTIVPEDPGRLAHVLRHWLAATVDVIIVLGGEERSSVWAPVDVARGFLEAEIPGFSVLVSLLAHESAGSKAMWIRSMAGFARGKLLFVLPRLRWVVDTAMDRLISPEIRSLAAARSPGKGGTP